MLVLKYAERYQGELGRYPGAQLASPCKAQSPPAGALTLEKVITLPGQIYSSIKHLTAINATQNFTSP